MAANDHWHPHLLRLNSSSPMLVDPSSLASTTPKSPCRASLFAHLRRRADPQLPEHEKFPILTLTLSASSFLDTLIRDDVTGRPLYTIKTAGNYTTVHRADPWDGPTETADIKWPRHPFDKPKHGPDSVVVNMRGICWNGSDTFLRRPAAVSGPRKFYIPNYAHSLKWRQVGALYWCETSAVKGPVAIFDPSEDSSHRLIIYETFHDKYDARPNLVHHGVSLVLLDYLLVTALFLVTEPHHWVRADRFPSVDVDITPTSDELDTSTLFSSLPSLPPRSAPGFTSTTDVQWRKIMFGEPLYQKRSRSSFSSSSSTSDGIPSGIRISADQMAKLAFGRPLYPKIRCSTPELALSDSEEDDQQSFFSSIRTHPPSPGIDGDIPTIPQIPTRYTASGLRQRAYGSVSSRSSIPSRHSRLSIITDDSDAHSSRVESSATATLRPSSTSSLNSNMMPSPLTQSNPQRGKSSLPNLPDLPPVPPLIPRPRSTPPRSMTCPPVTLEAPRLPPLPPQTPLEASFSSLTQAEENAASTSPSTSTSASTSTSTSTPTSTTRAPRKPLPQPPIPVPPIPTSAGPAYASMPPSDFIQRSRSRSHGHIDKWNHSGHYGSRMLPSPPTAGNSSRVALQQESDRGPYNPYYHPAQREESAKGAQAGPRLDMSVVHAQVQQQAPISPGGVPLYDVPPPAYTSINFGASGPPAPGAYVPLPPLSPRQVEERCLPLLPSPAPIEARDRSA